MYYIYHIPGKKIGVTRNLKNRVTLMQGYKKGEYEVLETHEDIDYVSKRELELQNEYGYKIDNKSYKELVNKNNKMNVNVTEQTTTFPCPVNKLKGQLMDNIGMIWQTQHGKFMLDKEMVRWIMKNARVSMYNNDRSYIYNKALAEWFNDQNALDTLLDYAEGIDRIEIFNQIRYWAKSRGLFDKGDAKTQYIKLQEEAGELAKALLKDDEEEVIDAIGDMVVVLTNLAHIKGVSIERCIACAYDVINKRTGKMINGTFVKDE
jgi:NTP pyrophosphatase (non-canonical NTP hydrolase)|tara:strand:- start:1 stop:789 length:789 start_codon:yes stop_codon:yes gene_type:complete